MHAKGRRNKWVSCRMLPVERVLYCRVLLTRKWQLATERAQHPTRGLSNQALHLAARMARLSSCRHLAIASFLAAKGRKGDRAIGCTS